ncbi:uncharacterized protein C8A04DRAFT_30762 [Dichotomopilus funicola]|uniref:Zn(2)-C6 fungal-type domain-containing protein n=1 Tax=Dichotomopilus funicola TaxID=1934379 RepID=A0AAN6ZLG8_9PEZI|nr:hypothetical protein C8A04DRAFT_30762 [Dichotomopilus funicola]
MVGVPGKYKGCETCRLKRVKCDNKRPFCQKCLDNNRPCAGYEREAVFIIGTLEDQGRCSSHPPRIVKPKSKASSSGTTGATATTTSRAASRAGSRAGSRRVSPAGLAAADAALYAAAVTPDASTSAGSTSVFLATPTPAARATGFETTTTAGATAGLDYAADGYTSGGTVDPFEAWAAFGCEEKWQSEMGLNTKTDPTMSPSAVVQGVPRPAWEDTVDVSWQGVGYQLGMAGCRTELEKVGRRGGSSSMDFDGSGTTNRVTLSLPEYRAPDVRPAMDGADFRLGHNNSTVFSNQPHWKDTPTHDAVRRLGPGHFRSFPAHHFFARVYRPNVIMTAILNRTPTFLFENHWLVTPYEHHPKAPLDRLLDQVVLLPALLTRADHLFAQESTLSRRLLAQDLLWNCLDFELGLSRWYESMQQQQDEGGENSTGGRKPGSTGSGLPYRSAHMTVAILYYWSSVVVFYPTIWRLYFAAAVDPVTVYTPETATTPGLSVPGDLPRSFPYLHQHHQQQQQKQQQLQPPTSHPPDAHDLPVPVPPCLDSVDPMRFALPRVREAANHICRTLDYLLVNRPLATAVTTVAQPAAEFHPQGDFAWGSEWNFPSLSSSSSSSSSSPSLSSSPIEPMAGPSATITTAEIPPRSSDLSDLLWHPLFVATRFYSELEGVPVRMDMNANILASPTTPTTATGITSDTIPGHSHSHSGGGSGGSGKGKGPVTHEGRLELMWCEDLRGRMLECGGERAKAVMGRRWVGVDLGLLG